MLSVATVLQATCARALRAGDDGELAPASVSPADLERTFGGVSVDSRALGADALFVALKGERVDGHDYVDQALACGALGALVSRLPPPAPLPPGRFLFVVPDPLVGLQELARIWRRGHQAEVVGITGSIGKTTTKEIVAGVLSRKWPVLKSEANLNTEIGLPLVLLGLRAEHRAAIVEMGMYAPGDIALLARIAGPRIGVVTNVAPIHLERMQTIERIARAKSELIAALPANGLAVLNGDDPWTRAMALTSGIAPVCLVGLGSDCHYRAAQVTGHGLSGISFTVEAEGMTQSFQSPVPGTHTVHAFLSAIAIGRTLGMSWEELRQAVAEVQFDARQRVLRGPEKLLIIDDSYNAAPPSVNAALQLLASAPGTKIAVLGDMLELGREEEEAHRQVGRRAAEVTDWLVVRGPRSRWIAEGAESRGLLPERILQAGSNAEALESVRRILSAQKPEDGGQVARTMQGAAAENEPGVEWSVLVKGSRGMRMEEVVQGLREEA